MTSSSDVFPVRLWAAVTDGAAVRPLVHLLLQIDIHVNAVLHPLRRRMLLLLLLLVVV